MIEHRQYPKSPSKSCNMVRSRSRSRSTNERLYNLHKQKQAKKLLLYQKINGDEISFSEINKNLGIDLLNPDKLYKCKSRMESDVISNLIMTSIKNDKHVRKVSLTESNKKVAQLLSKQSQVQHKIQQMKIDQEEKHMKKILQNQNLKLFQVGTRNREKKVMARFKTYTD